MNYSLFITSALVFTLSGSSIAQACASFGSCTEKEKKIGVSSLVFTGGSLAGLASLSKVQELGLKIKEIDNLPRPKDILGDRRWVGLTRKGYGPHGTYWVKRFYENASDQLVTGDRLTFHASHRVEDPKGYPLDRQKKRLKVSSEVAQGHMNVSKADWLQMEIAQAEREFKRGAHSRYIGGINEDEMRVSRITRESAAHAALRDQRKVLVRARNGFKIGGLVSTAIAAYGIGSLIMDIESDSVSEKAKSSRRSKSYSPSDGEFASAKTTSKASNAL